MKIFNYMDKIQSLPETNDLVLPPIHLRIKPTNTCNQKCRYCAYLDKNLQLGNDMNLKDMIPKEKMMEIIDDLDDMSVKAITFSGGGEPLCYPYFKETLMKLSKTNIKFAALTNGSRLKDDLAIIFSKYATWVRVSIDGWDDESYSDYRGVANGSYTKLMSNLNNFSKLDGDCFLSVCIIVDKQNATHLNNLIHQLKDVGVKSIKIAPCIISNKATENNFYHKSIENIVKDQIDKTFEQLASDEFEIFDSYHLQLESFQKHYSWCPYLQILPVIGADCNVYACHDKAYNLDQGLLGSIKKQRFKDMWLSEKSVFFQINPSIHCNHHCVVNAHNHLLFEFLDIDDGHRMFV